MYKASLPVLLTGIPNAKHQHKTMEDPQGGPQPDVPALPNVKADAEDQPTLSKKAAAAEPMLTAAPPVSQGTPQEEEGQETPWDTTQVPMVSVHPLQPDSPRGPLPMGVLVGGQAREGQDPKWAGTADSWSHSLQIPMSFKTSTGQTKRVMALVDTGAQISLINQGLLKPEDSTPLSRPERLFGVGGEKVRGGDRQASLTLMANGVWETEESPTLMSCHLPSKLVEADIPVDVILSYKWLVDHKVTVDPYQQALHVDVDGKTFFIKGMGTSAAQVDAGFPIIIDTTRMGPAQMCKKKHRRESPCQGSSQTRRVLSSAKIWQSGLEGWSYKLSTPETRSSTI